MSENGGNQPPLVQDSGTPSSPVNSADGAQDQFVRIYGFKVIDELVHGWQAHARKQQLIHEKSARRIQHKHYLIGGLAVLFASLAGSSAVAAWQKHPPNTGSNSSLAIISASIAAIASILTGIITFLDLGGRAEQHRKAAASYKQALRTMEAFSIEVRTSEWVRKIQANLGDIDVSAPIPPRKIAEDIEKKPVKLCSSVSCASMESPSRPPARDDTGRTQQDNESRANAPGRRRGRRSGRARPRPRIAGRWWRA